MIEQILIGQGNVIREMPRPEWERMLRQTPEHAKSRLAFMTEDHHRIRRMAVTNLVQEGRALEPAYFVERLEVDLESVVEILDELERKLFFLVRNQGGAVSWAYPVTVDRTPHKLTFSTGERLHGA